MKHVFLPVFLLLISTVCSAQHEQAKQGITVSKKTTNKEAVISVGGVEKSIAWESMKPEQVKAMTRVFDELDREQYDLVIPHLAKLVDNPAVVSDVMKELHSRSVVSPYAGLWGAVIKTAANNDLEGAEKLLLDVKRRILIQQALEPSLHRQTLSSVYNNLAVIKIKQGGGDAAAGYLTSAIKNSRAVLPIFSKNISQLLAFPEGAKAGVSRDARNKVVKTLSASVLSSVDTQLSNPGWYYSLDFDVPAGVGRVKRIQGIDPPVVGLELASVGTGVVITDGIILTARENVATSIDNKLITIAYVNKNGVWDSHAAMGVLVEEDKIVVTGGAASNTVRHTETNYRGRRLSSSSESNTIWTKFKVIPPKPGSPGERLAAISVRNFPVEPIEFADDAYPDKLALRSYGYSAEAIANGAIDCSVTVTNRQPLTVTSPELQNVSYGSAVFTGDGGLVGLLTARNDASCILTKASGIRQWARDNIKVVQIEDCKGGAIEKAKNATVLVLAWSPSERDLLTRVADSTKLSGQLFVIDTWCIACSGKGFTKCGTCAGRGFVSQRSAQVVNQTQIGTQFGARFDNVPCPNCDTNKVFKCPHCQGGRLPNSQ